ncbi:hypothetical protein [Streptomyces sp. ISL-11]|uniref:hypothetical protein n=1 Tax=Streptomyces sp. ISL-11 TaxID=2819174 RepID=UPI001BEA034C|nr:hypothetical protein [Streptomyces sp. ISL-11]MBT2382796.1 hypothetical protein [Streptomyces sp. ISL-11]
MRRSTVRRTAVAASAISLALLVSACGSEEPAAKDEPKDKPSSGAPAAPGGNTKALSQAELEKLVLTESDLKDHKIEKPSAVDVAAAKTVSGDKAECKPLVDIMALRAPGGAGASVSRKIAAIAKPLPADASAEDKMKAGMGALGVTVTVDTLASYEGKGAADAVAALKKAGADCAGGFTLNAGDDKTKITKVEGASYTAGDESVAFTITVDMEGMPGTGHLVSVRKGSTVATFYSQSLTGKAEQPKAVIEAQVKKLG